MHNVTFLQSAIDYMKTHTPEGENQVKKCKSCGAPMVFFAPSIQESFGREGPECMNADCPSHKPKEPEIPVHTGPRPGERWTDQSAYRAMENALLVFLKDPKIRKFLDENDPKAVEQAENALKIDKGNWNDLVYFDKRKNPGNACWADYRIVGKTVSRLHADHYREGKNEEGDDMKHPFIDLHFTDGTHVRLEPCDDGLAEDFGKGPKKILDLPYIGVTEYSEYPKKEEKKP
jgi:hypothetical protein